MFVRMRRAARGTQHGGKRNHFDHDRAVVVNEPRQSPTGHDITTELFLDFADQRRLGRFIGLHLSAGEFPLEPQMFVRGPLRDEDVPGIILNDGANNGNGGTRIQCLENGDSRRSLQLFVGGRVLRK